jgi:CheY-like chemotaxis protein/anti-sigma regulatory factor (Ser/Thr protein kinase)
VIGDPTRLRQIVLNLLSNAIKFSASTPNDPKCIEIEVKPAEGAQYSISVQDHGIGMTESEASRLFAPFIQADKATTRRFGGTGLGLAIVKRLVTLMNGEVSVQSAPRQGSCFTVTVPLFSAISQTTPMPKGLNGLICRVYGIAKCPAVITCLSYLHHAGIVATLSEEDAAEGEIRIVPQVLGAEPLELIHLGQWIAAIGDIPGRLSLGWMRRERLLNAIALAIDPNLRSQAFANKPTITAVEVEPEEYTHLPPKRHRLLVAEDDVINRRVIGQQLALLGYSAILVEDGKAALAAWRAGGFDLLITDMTMPEMDGLELIQIIRGEETAQMHTPIIMLSANAMQGDAERAEADGADLYLTKPIVLSELQTALKRLLHDA